MSGKEVNGGGSGRGGGGRDEGGEWGRKLTLRVVAARDNNGGAVAEVMTVAQ